MLVQMALAKSAEQGMSVHKVEISRATQVLREKLACDPSAFAVVVAGPSGVGKTTICRRVLSTEPDVRRCVTTTTRAPRQGEMDGQDRHFVSEQTFRNMLERGEFIEYAQVHGHWYGAAVEAVQEALSDGHVMLMDVDVQGVQTWVEVLADRCVTVFVLPPSMGALSLRLSQRKSESRDIFQLRMDNAIAEMRQAASYDYLIVNEDLRCAVDDLKAIIRAERSRTRRRSLHLSELGFEQKETCPPHHERM